MPLEAGRLTSCIRKREELGLPGSGVVGTSGMPRGFPPATVLTQAFKRVHVTPRELARMEGKEREAGCISLGNTEGL